MNDFNSFEEARRTYEDIPIPEALEGRIREGIQQGRTARALRKKHRDSVLIGAAACFMVLIASLNLSPSIAHAAARVPVLGGLFRVLTITSYDAADDGISYSLEVPGIEADGEMAAEVNAVIQAKVDQHLEKARQDWADYKDAFFATGGTEEQWADREMNVTVDYEIKSQTDTRVSFVVTMTEGWVAAMEEQYCYNLDLAENREITLRDLLGEDWVSISSKAIQRQIEESRDAEGFTYFFSPEDGGFTAVDENTAFYIREDGVPVAVFPRYSIAAGAAGCPEFPLA
ncbi:MAG: DUF3298 domain-containing protein [Oscillibacter sp.]|nr:DUF3298 domain-containing protein [Oscillibacter sp.]